MCIWQGNQPSRASKIKDAILFCSPFNLLYAAYAEIIRMGVFIAGMSEHNARTVSVFTALNSVSHIRFGTSELSEAGCEESRGLSRELFCRSKDSRDFIGEYDRYIVYINSIY